MKRIINATLMRQPDLDFEYVIEPLSSKRKTTKRKNPEEITEPFKVSELKYKKLKSLKKSKITKSIQLIETKKLWSYKEERLLNKAQIYLEDGWKMMDAVNIIMDSKTQNQRFQLTVVRDLAC